MRLRKAHGRNSRRVVGGAAVAQIGVAGYFGLQASDLHDKNSNIDGAADRSTLFTITGVVTAAVAVYLFLTWRP